ncbi:hypothetical protein [Enterococcus sp. AZ103]|uniref:hypothetical protein n=1 Tax=Enterococcus sp. AZ103 TaxID=2774628 RepID=UPI003F209710
MFQVNVILTILTAPAMIITIHQFAKKKKFISDKELVRYEKKIFLPASLICVIMWITPSQVLKFLCVISGCQLMGVAIGIAIWYFITHPPKMQRNVKKERTGTSH